MKRLAFLAFLLLACGKPSPRPVLFIGLDGADWQLLDSYMKDGSMPNLAALAREGQTGVLTTIQPPLLPLAPVQRDRRRCARQGQETLRRRDLGLLQRPRTGPASIASMLC